MKRTVAHVAVHAHARDGGLHGTLMALRNPAFARLYLAQLVHLLGDALVWVALALLAFELAGERAAVVLGIALTLRVTAFVVLSPFAGVLADRVSRKAIMVTALLARMGLLAGLAVATSEAQLYLAMLVMNALTAFFTPTYQASVPAVRRAVATTPGILTRMQMRPATESDCPRIVVMLRRMVEEMSQLGHHPTSTDASVWASMENQLRASLLDDDACLLVLEQARDAIGFASAEVVRPHPVFESRRVLHVSSLYVEPALRRSGHGRRLLQTCLDWGRDRGCLQAQLNVLQSSPARSLYSAMEFAVLEVHMTRSL